jgi:hypothetical protein
MANIRPVVPAAYTFTMLAGPDDELQSLNAAACRAIDPRVCQMNACFGRQQQEAEFRSGFFQQGMQVS